MYHNNRNGACIVIYIYNENWQMYTVITDTIELVHVQLITDTIGVVLAKSGTHIHLSRDTIATGIAKHVFIFRYFHVYNAAGPKYNEIVHHCDINMQVSAMS